MKRMLMLSLLFCSVSSAVFAQTYTPVKTEAPTVDTYQGDSGKAFGITAGLVTGVGMSFLYYPQTWGIKATFIPIVNSDEEAWVNGGFCVMKTMYTQRVLRLFWYTGMSFWYDRFKDYIYNSAYDESITRMKTEYRVHITTGPGALIKVENIGLEMMSGYGFYAKRKKSGYSWQSNLTIETSAYFFF